MESTTKQIILANYGRLKLARYLVRSYNDFADVCQTVARQVLHCADPEKVFELFNAIECKCALVPNTLSSMIVGFNVPEKILRRQGYRTRPSRIPELRVPPTQAPRYECNDERTTFSLKVTCFFDLYLLHRFILEAINLPGEGMKLIKSKRTARLGLSDSDSTSTSFKLAVTFACKCDHESLVQLETRFLRQALTGN